jgi:IS4 transposase
MGGIDIRLFARKREKDGQGDYMPKGKHSGRQAGIEEKESYRWIIGGIAAKERLGTAGVTVVRDREGDIYESFCLLSEAGVDFVIRVNHNRTVRDDEDERKKPGEHLEQLSAAYEYRMRAGKKGEKPREARLEVKYGKVRLERPGHIGGGGRKYAKEQQVFVVQVQEHGQTMPLGKQGIQRRLYTSHEVKSREDAEKIIEYYRKRWIIEDLFRTLKRKG